MAVIVKHSKALHEHLMTFQVDGGAVGSTLFEDGGRLNYPGRKDLEQVMGYPEPYTLEHESRVIQGLPNRVAAAVRLLARAATNKFRGTDPTLDMLWGAHEAYTRSEGEGPSLDRLVAALVMVEYVLEHRTMEDDVFLAAEVLINGMHMLGFPPTAEGLEELFDGAEPASVALGAVEI